MVRMGGSGQVFEGLYAGQRCRCQQRTSAFIRPHTYTRLEIFPKGINCQRVEVIITLESGNMVCVEPGAKWLKTILGYLDRKKKQHERSK
ncbi:C-X-C motif chemokine 13 isoform X2 [Lissotriton helveticus]